MKSWTWQTCDTKFRKFLQRRYAGEKCMKCHRRYWTDVAHYIDRDIFATRWSFANVLLLCRICHRYFDLGRRHSPFKSKTERMRPFMVKTFGEELVSAIEWYAGIFQKRADSIRDMMEASKKWPS